MNISYVRLAELSSPPNDRQQAAIPPWYQRRRDRRATFFTRFQFDGREAWPLITRLVHGAIEGPLVTELARSFKRNGERNDASRMQVVTRRLGQNGR
jgi:hypothetical protein